MKIEKTFKIDYKKLDRTYDCTLFRDKELLFKTLSKLSNKNIRIVLDKPNTEIYRIETF